MQAAKDAVKNFTSKRGESTEVDEVVHPSVTSETVKPHRHEETTQAIDREVHQHHYHTTVQPVQHEERLPEKHTHNIIPTEHRETHHEDPEHTKSSVAAHLAQFKPSSVTHETTHSTAAAPAVTGEHVHHHVHENVIPVIHKSTVQPEVVHTTQPIHETHHVESKHHGISQLPMKTLEEFKTAGGILDGRTGHSHEEYDGKPRPYNEKLSTTFDKLGLGHGHSEHGSNTTGQTGVGHSGVGQTGHSGIGHSSNGQTGVGNSGIAHPSNGANSGGLSNNPVSGSQQHGGVGSGVGGTVGAGSGAAAVGNKVGGGHRATDSGVSGIGGGGGNLRRSDSDHSSDFEYSADGTKHRKNKDSLRDAYPSRNVV